MKRAAIIGGTNCLGNNLILTPLHKDYDILIVSYLSCNMLAETALGLNNSITQAIIDNKTIYVLEYGLKYKNISNKAVFARYDSYLKVLISYGVKLINCTDDIFSFQKSKKLLTVADFSTYDDKIIILDKNTIVTPLALDYAKENNISIIRSDTQ